MSKSVILAPVLVAMLFSPLAYAQDCQVPATSADAALPRILVTRALGCMGGDKDKDPLSVRVTKAVKAAQCVPPAGAAQVETLRRTLAALADDIKTDLRSRSTTAPAPWAEPLAVVSSELEAAETSLADTSGIAAPVHWQWAQTGHRTFQQTDGSLLLDYEPVVRASCAIGAGECASSVAAAINVNRAVELSRLVNQCATQGRLEGSRQALTQLDADWNHYFFETRSQFIWELAVNSWRFKDKQDQFARPPKDQIILAHPGVAFEYVGGGAQNEQAYEATVMAELVGYNRFTWDPRSDGTSSKLPPLGVSLVATYTPDNTGEHTGYGVMFHIYNSLSVGVTRRDTGAGDETTYLLSMDLMRLLLNPSPEAIAEFRGKK